jgi:RNA polymerase sigma factor (sigma-70 family)
MPSAEIEDVKILEYLRHEHHQNEGFRLLIKKYQESLYFHIRRMVESHDDADDVLQNVFIKIFRNINNFQQQSSLFTWIYRIATNECLTFIEKNKRSRSTISIDDNQMSLGIVANASIDASKTLASLDQAISRLPEKQKLVFNMRYYDEMSYQEMSEITQTSVGALKASYHHAVKKIEEYVTSHIE